MEPDSYYWISRWTDHLIDAFHLDSDAILARNAEALELGYLEGVPDEVLVLFHIDVEGVRENPEGTIRLLQSSYEATLRLVASFQGTAGGERAGGLDLSAGT